MDGRKMRDGNQPEVSASSQSVTEMPGHPGASDLDQSESLLYGVIDNDLVSGKMEGHECVHHGHPLCQTTQLKHCRNDFEESHDNTYLNDSRTQISRATHSMISTCAYQILVRCQPIKWLALTINSSLANQRPVKSSRGLMSMCWMFLLVSWQISTVFGRPSTQELMHMVSAMPFHFIMSH